MDHGAFMPGKTGIALGGEGVFGAGGKFFGKFSIHYPDFILILRWVLSGIRVRIQGPGSECGAPEGIWGREFLRFPKSPTYSRIDPGLELAP
jgi:hypothetical protein